MGENSKIEWTHHTFNPWWGCVKVSPGCANCYAESFAKRTGHDVWKEDGERRLFGDKHWAEPVKWNAEAKAAGVRCRVFCASMADVFEDHLSLDEPRERLLALIDDTPHLDWLLLTKRPENIIPLMDRAMRGNFDPQRTFARHLPNVWLGTTVENQAMANKRIPKLLEVAAKVRFLSCEPLLSHVDLTRPVGVGYRIPDGIHWVICGGESGPRARPMHPEWACSLRDQCASADVPFFFKQWGEWMPLGSFDHGGRLDEVDEGQYRATCAIEPSGAIVPESRDRYEYQPGIGAWLMGKAGKKAAGRVLNGCEHNGFPNPEREEALRA